MIGHYDRHLNGYEHVIIKNTIHYHDMARASDQTLYPGIEYIFCKILILIPGSTALFSQPEEEISVELRRRKINTNTAGVPV